jgi:ABC-type sugar transport system substrate-binding protein
MEPNMMTNKRIFLTLIWAALLLCLTASGCRTAQPNQIAFVVTTLSNPYFVDMTEAAKAEIRTHPGFTLSVQAPERAVDVARQIDLVDT